MTIAEIKPTLTAYFDSKVETPNVQEQFANTLDLWRDMKCMYDTTNNAYKAIIDHFVQPINEEIARIKLASAEFTIQRTTTTHQVQTGERNVDVTGTTDTTNDVQYEQGGSTVTNEIYPDGYIQAPDEAYVKTRQVDEHAPEKTLTSDKVASASKTAEDNNSNTDGTYIVEELNASELKNIIDVTPRLADLIEECAFAFVSGKVSLWQRNIYRCE